MHRKKKKYKREENRNNWKTIFGRGENHISALLIRGKEDEGSILNMTIDNFLKNLTKLQSSKQISHKKISGMRRLDSRDSKLD